MKNDFSFAHSVVTRVEVKSLRNEEAHISSSRDGFRSRARKGGGGESVRNEETGPLNTVYLNDQDDSQHDYYPLPILLDIIIDCFHATPFVDFITQSSILNIIDLRFFYPKMIVSLKNSCLRFACYLVAYEFFIPTDLPGTYLYLSRLLATRSVRIRLRHFISIFIRFRPHQRWCLTARMRYTVREWT